MLSSNPDVNSGEIGFLIVIVFFILIISLLLLRLQGHTGDDLSIFFFLAVHHVKHVKEVAKSVKYLKKFLIGTFQKMHCVLHVLHGEITVKFLALSQSSIDLHTFFRS